jgi:biopolymer transport protein ExbD
MNKRGFIFSLFCLVSIFFLTTFVLAEGAPDSGLPGSDKLKQSDVYSGVSKLQNITSNLTRDEIKWEYLQQQWQQAMQNNKYLKPIDQFCKKINIVFVLITANDYSMTFSFYMIIVIWIIFFLILSKYASNIFSQPNIALLVGAAATILLAQFRILNYIVDGVIGILAYKSEWYWKLVLFLIVVIFFIVALKFNTQISRYMEKQKKKKKEEKQAQQVKAHENWLNAVKGIGFRT